MGLAYNVFTEQEALSVNLVPQNDYDFEVVSAKHKVSKNGTDMLEILLKVILPNGSSRSLFDYILLTDQWAFKFRHFCFAIGMGAEYESKTFDENKCSGRTGRKARIIQQEGTNGYAPKNVVKDYIVQEGGAVQEKVEFEDSDIPF